MSALPVWSNERRLTESACNAGVWGCYGNPDIFTGQQPTKQQVHEAIAAYYAVFMTDGNGDNVVRTRQFSCLEFKSGKADVPVALYDLKKDSWETVNLADDSAYAACSASLPQRRLGQSVESFIVRSDKETYGHLR